MSLRDVLTRWSRETITREPYAGLDAYGQRTYGAAETYKARIEHRARLVRDAHGEERVSQVQVYLASTTIFDVKDRLTLPDGTTPLMLALERVPDHQGESWYQGLFA